MVRGFRLLGLSCVGGSFPVDGLRCSPLGARPVYPYFALVDQGLCQASRASPCVAIVIGPRAIFGSGFLKAWGCVPRPCLTVPLLRGRPPELPLYQGLPIGALALYEAYIAKIRGFLLKGDGNVVGPRAGGAPLRGSLFGPTIPRGRPGAVGPFP